MWPDRHTSQHTNGPASPTLSDLRLPYLALMSALFITEMTKLNISCSFTTKTSNFQFSRSTFCFIYLMNLATGQRTSGAHSVAAVVLSISLMHPPLSRYEHIADVMQLTQRFKFESGTEAGVNWRSGIKFSPGTYRVKGNAPC